MNAIQPIISCVACNPELQAQIFDDRFLLVGAMLAAPFVLAGVLFALLHRLT